MFTARRSRSSLAALACGALLLTTACEPAPSTLPKDIVDYARNASVDADVRRLDAEAQTYVDAVFKAHAAWKNTIDPMDAIADIDEFWAVDAKEWRDGDELSQRYQVVITYFLSQAPPPAKKEDEKVPSSSKDGGDEPKKSDDDDALDAATPYLRVFKAIENVPASYKQGKDKLIADMLATLKIASTKADADRNAGEYRDLLTYVLRHADELDPASAGLSFTNTETTAGARELWAQLHTRFERERSEEVGGLEGKIAEDRSKRDEALDAKRELRSEGDSSPERFRRLRELELLVRYHQSRMTESEKRKRALDRKARDQEKARQEAEGDKVSRDAA